MIIEAPGVEVADLLADLWVDLAADQRDYGSHLLDEENREGIHESLVRHTVGGTILVAREDDALLGFVSFRPDAGNFEQDVSRGIIENIYVIPGRRGEGIGSELLKAAEEALANTGVDVVALEAMADNEAARRFYRRHGYDPHRVELERETDTKVDE